MTATPIHRRENENQSSTPSGTRLDHYIMQLEHWQPAEKNTTLRSGTQKMVANLWIPCYNPQEIC
jgi:hypothetical protein